MTDAEELIDLAVMLEKKAKLADAKAALATHEQRDDDAAAAVINAEYCRRKAAVCRRMAEVKPKKPKKEPKPKKVAGEQGGPAFEAFWLEYPTRRKTGKGKCRDIWKRKGCDRFAAKIMETLKKAKASIDWTKEGGEFTPMPATWLNREGWDDEFAAPQQPGLFRNVADQKDPPGWKEFLKANRADYREYWRATEGVRKKFNELPK